MSRPRDNGIKSLLNSFGYAVRGLLLCLREERNLRIHLTAACWAVYLGAVCLLARGEWAALAVCCGLVISSEIFNTSVEATVDLLSPDYHPVARRAKDIAAAGVLVGASFAVITGGVLFWDKLPLMLDWFLATAASPFSAVMHLLFIATSLLFVFAYPRLFDNREETPN